MKLNKKLTIVSLLLCLQYNLIIAQRTVRFTEDNYRLKEAVTLIDAQYYQQAYILLNDYLTHYRQNHRAMQEFVNQQAACYYHLCALKLNKPEAEQAYNSFIKQTPFKPLKQIGSFHLGSYYYEHNQFEDCIKYHEAAGIEVLTNQDLTKRNFELGYAYLVTQNLDKVTPYFQSAKNIHGDYFTPGNYYHGLLSYYKKQYPEAKQSFNAVKNDERYKNIIPFYLTEIDYLTGEKDKALKSALTYLKSLNKLYYDVELNQMVAQIYYEQEDFEKAENYYANYISLNKTAHDEDYFKLGYCQYQQGKIERTIQSLEKISLKDHNELSKQTTYLLALCHLKSGNKINAYQVLSKNKNLDWDTKKKELIAFTMAKLSYDNGEDNVALAELNSFIKSYPQAEQIDEANELLAFLNIKYDNFNDAVIAMNKLRNISLNLKKVYQKANYARGIQMLKDENPERAIFNFQETKKFPIDQTTISLAEFWLSECHYRLGRYAESMASCDLFLNQADTIAMPEYTKKIHLTKSYIHFVNNENGKFVEEYVIGSGDTNTADLLSRVGTTKANYIPEKIPVVDYQPYLFVYNLPEEKMDFMYKPIPLKPLAINNEIKREDQTNFLRLGLGNFSTLDFGVGLNLDNLVNMPLYVDFNHSASTGKISYQRVNQTHLGAFTNTELYDHKVDASFTLDRNKQYYYGFNRELYNYDNVDIKQVFQNVGVNAVVTPLTENEYDIKYKANLYTGLYTDRFGAGEYTVKMDAPISKQLKPDLLAHSDFVLDANAYFVKGENTQGNSLVSWRPSLIKQLNQFRLKAGLNVALGKQFYLLPDVSLQYQFIKNSTVMELALQSNIRLNTFKQMTEFNPFIFNYYNVKQSKNTELTIGVKGSTSSRLSYALRSGVGIYNNLPLFLNDTAFDNKQFNVFYEKEAIAFLLDASIDYTINSEMLAGGRINLRPLVNLYSNKEAWHYLPSFINFYGKLRVTKDIVLKTDMFLMPGTKAIHQNPLITSAYTQTLAPGFDCNISAQIAINKRWNANIDVNNLLNSKYQRWYRYEMYGTNVLFGLTHSFKSIEIKQY
jgi:TolA-binding protein/Fe-S cluster assembly iron-binding protein IscA